MLFLVVSNVRAHWRRFIATALGLGFAYAAILLAYALAASVQLQSSAALSYVVADGSVWITGPGTPEVDQATHSLIQESHISPDAADRIIGESNGSLAPIVVQRTTWAGRPITVYWDGRRRSRDGAAISSRLSRAVGSQPFPAPLSVARPTSLEVRDDLPGQTIVLPYDWFQPTANEGPTWIVGRVSTRNARDVAAAQGLAIRDNLANERSPRDNGTVFLLNSSLSRFDPFSFETKFSALQLNGVTSSLLGWVSRLVFLLGAAFAISSLMMSIEERRPEIAALAALGYEPEFTQMALIEASFLFIASILIGLSAAAALSVFVLRPGELFASLAAGLGLSAFFTIFVLVLATLLMGQSVAKRSVVSLMRGTT